MTKTASAANYAVRLENVTKRFPGVVANDEVHLAVRAGSLHAVVGENGAGKSTLLNILYGRYVPNSGRIYVNDNEVTKTLRSPSDAIRLGIGLVSQHHALIPALTVGENVTLGDERGPILSPTRLRAAIEPLTEPLGLTGIDLNARADSLTVAARQKVEVLKALYRNAKILLLDEPTATLAPGETDALFELLHGLVERGATVVYVTHKLREVMAHSGEVTVLRAGRNVGDFVTSEVDERELLVRMIGTRSGAPLTNEAYDPRTLTRTSRFDAPPEPIASQPSANPLLQVERVTVRDDRRSVRLREAGIQVARGEIVGVAGVDGSGQRELAEAVAGLRPLDAGRVFLAGRDVTRLSVRARIEAGIATIHEDRLLHGIVGEFTVAENYLLGHDRDPAWGGGALLNGEVMTRRANEAIKRYDVRVGMLGAEASAATLSGGNQQKLVIARALEAGPQLLIAFQPTRGLDVGATEFTHGKLLDARAAGMGVLLISLDLDELLALSDRIVVLFQGRVAGVVPRSEASSERIGELMTGAQSGASS